MRKQTKTLRAVHEHYTQIEHMKHTNSILYDANYVYFNNWQKMNSTAINRLNGFLEPLDKKYFVHEDLGGGMFQFPRDKDGNYHLKEGMSLDDYRKEYNDFVNLPSVIYV